MTGSSMLNGESESQRPRWKWNALFRGDFQLASFNACVGDNGGPDIYYYADGYAESVDLLIDSVISRQGTLDTLIYPICFSLRHFVELTVKAQIQDLSLLAKVRKQPLATDNEIERVLNQHDILNLWNFYSMHAIASDRRYLEPMAAAETLIRCIGETDPTGQTFRYSYGTDEQKHLTDVSVINVIVLRDQFRLIRDNLVRLTNLTDYLLTEYRTGTFTRRLNREDLMSIAELLPPRQSWPEEAAGFIGIKATLKAAYGIGSRELSEAITKIAACRDMARLIGCAVDVPGLSADDLSWLNDCWKLAWKPDVLERELRENIDGGSSGPVLPVTMLQVINTELHARNDPRASLAAFRQWATMEKLAGLQALLDAGGFTFCEDHDRIYERYLKQMTEEFASSSAGFDEEVSDIWSRTLGRPSYPVRMAERLKGAGFRYEADRLIENILA